MSGSRFLLTALFIAALLVVFTKIRLSDLWDSRVLTQAVVIDIDVRAEKTVHGSNFINETIQFEYMVDGHMLRPRQTFFYDTSFFIGQTVPALYLPETPWVARIQTEILVESNATLIVAVAFGLLIAIMIVGFVINAKKPHEKQKRKEKASL